MAGASAHPIGFILFRLLVVTLAATTHLSVSAATVNGVILANEENGEPMANVGLVAEGANPTISDTFGRFRLDFPHKNPGDPVKVIVKRDGYVVVNDVQLELALPAKTEETILTIILCKEADREEMARRFYRLKSDEAIEAAYQQKVAELQQQHRTDAAALANLQREREQARAAGAQASEQLAKNGPAQSSELYEQTKRLFVEGKINEAIQLLSSNDEKRRESVAEATKAIKQQKQRIDNAVQEWLFTAYMQTMLLDLDAAKYTYTQLLQVAPDSFQGHLAYARFNHELRRDLIAEQQYEWCSEWAQKSGSQSELADALDGLADIKSSQYSTKEAERYFDQAIKLRRNLANTDDERYKAALANTLLNLGTFYWNERQVSLAEQPIQEAKDIYQELQSKYPQKYALRLAGALNNLGVMNRDRNHLTEGREELQSALDILRKLAPDYQDDYQASLARTLSNLGILDVREEKFKDAMPNFQEALNIRRKLAERNWEEQAPDLATTLTNMGSLYIRQDNLAEARRSLKEALEIRRALVSANAKRYLPNLAISLEASGGLYLYAGAMEEARRDYSEALQIYYSLAIRNPNIFWRDLADVAAKLVFVLVVEHLRLILVTIGSLMIVLAFWLRARRKRHKGE